MSNTRYEIRTDFLLSVKWEVLSRSVRERIEELQDDPKPAKYEYRKLPDGHTITIPDGEEDVIVDYEIYERERIIDLGEIRRAKHRRKNKSALRQIAEFAAELVAGFEPGAPGKPKK